MTGIWQVLGSSRIPLHEMVKIDYLYGANWSLWLDVKILLRTIPHMLGRRGALIEWSTCTVTSSKASTTERRISRGWWPSPGRDLRRAPTRCWRLRTISTQWSWGEPRRLPRRLCSYVGGAGDLRAVTDARSSGLTSRDRAQGKDAARRKAPMSGVG